MPLKVVKGLLFAGSGCRASKEGEDQAAAKGDLSSVEQAWEGLSAGGASPSKEEPLHNSKGYVPVVQVSRATTVEFRVWIWQFRQVFEGFPVVKFLAVFW